MAIAPEPKVSYNPLTGLTYNPNATAPAAAKGPQPTVTIGGAPAGYAPTTTMQPTVTIGGAPAGYAPAATPNYITGEGVPGVQTSTPAPTPAAATKPVDTPVPTPTGTTFPKAGTLIRYEAGSTAATRTPVYADGKGGEYRGPEDVNPLIPGSTGTTKESDRTLAKDTFANTLALLVGAKEATQPWVNEIYNLASGFYNTGSTIEESLNLSLYDAKAKGLAPQFTKRFAGVFALQDKLQKGEAVTVPTIANFIKTEAEMGDVLREAGLNDLATQDFLGGVIGAGNSLLDVSNLISKTFTTIDNAPAALRKTLDTYFPSVDRVSLAKALLTGSEGAAALDKKIKGISVLSAAGSQGISTDLATASDLAAQGVDYGTALTGFGQVKELQRGDTLARMQGETFTQQEAIGLTFEQNQAAKDKAEKIKAAEIAKFQGGPGLSASALRGKNTRQQI